MRNIYHSDIMNLLIRQGKEGMKVKLIAKKIYNMHVDLFNRSLDYTDLRHQLSMYLWRQSRQARSPFQRLGYGLYAVKPDLAVQLDLFWDAPEVKKEEPRRSTHKDLQLTFDFEF